MTYLVVFKKFQTPPNTTDEWNKFVDLIMSGDFTMKSPFTQLMCRSLAKCKCLHKLRAIDDNQERVNLFSPSFPFPEFKEIFNSINEGNFISFIHTSIKMLDLSYLCLTFSTEEE